MADRTKRVVGRISFPVKLDIDYPCRGFDAEGNAVFFDDLLYEGDLVPDYMDDDGNHYGPMHPVVYRDEQMWIEAEVVVL